MAEKEKIQRLEIEAKWAPSDDKSTWQKPEKSQLEIWYYKIAAKLDPNSWKQEEEKLSLKKRFRNWPRSILKSLPTATVLLCLYLATQVALSVLTSGQSNETWKLFNFRLILFWLGTVSILLGWQVASYPHGRLKPSLMLILEGVGRNWLYFALMGLFLVYSDVFGATKSENIVQDLVNSLFVVVILFGVMDMKVYRQGEKDELVKK